MMCKKPYMRDPTGVIRSDTKVSYDKRLSATPFGCGQCIHCRANKAREWTTRILLEMFDHGDSIFITLTYNDEHLPHDNNLQKRDVQNFIKRLRKDIQPQKIRYFMVGEYGDRSGRPHYHGALFGIGLMQNERIGKAWSMGFVKIGDLNKNSARYMTGYIMKGWKKGHRDLGQRTPEFMLSSKKGGGLGIGSIKKIAKVLSEDKNFDKKLVKTLRMGKRDLPIGRYLTNKLIEFRGMDPMVARAAFVAYQESVFDEHMKPNKHYYFSLLEKDRVKRERQEKLQKIFKQRRSL